PAAGSRPAGAAATPDPAPRGVRSRRGARPVRGGDAPPSHRRPRPGSRAHTRRSPGPAAEAARSPWRPRPAAGGAGGGRPPRFRAGAGTGGPQGPVRDGAAARPGDRAAPDGRSLVVTGQGATPDALRRRAGDTSRRRPPHMTHDLETRGRSMSTPDPAGTDPEESTGGTASE